MRRYRNRAGASAMLLSGCLAAVLAVWAVPAAAQEGDDEKDPAFSQKFWEYLQKSDYREKWSRWPGKEEGFQESESPQHGALLKVYVNDEAKSDLKNPPAKAIILKENYNKDKELVAITPMYRVGKDYDSEHNDWYWAKYKPDGTVFEQDGKKLSGRVEGCIRCHSSAQGKDFIFANDG